MKELIELAKENIGIFLLVLGMIVLLKNISGILLIGKESSEKIDGKNQKYLSILFGIVLFIVGLTFPSLQKLFDQNTTKGDKDSSESVRVDTTPPNKSDLTNKDEALEYRKSISENTNTFRQITGYVYDPNNLKLAGATVKIRDSKPVRTDENGFFRLEIMEEIHEGANLSITFDHPNYKVTTLPRPFNGGDVNLYFEK